MPEATKDSDLEVVRADIWTVYRHVTQNTAALAERMDRIESALDALMALLKEKGRKG